MNATKHANELARLEGAVAATLEALLVRQDYAEALNLLHEIDRRLSDAAVDARKWARGTVVVDR